CVAIHPGSGGRDKCWPAERFAELAHALKGSQEARILLIEGPADAERLRQFEAHGRGNPPRRLSQRPLTWFAAILSCCDRFSGSDSGITPLAAAVGVPVLALFGPTDPAVWGPRGRAVQIIRRPLDDLTVAEVLAALSAG